MELVLTMTYETSSLEVSLSTEIIANVNPVKIITRYFDHGVTPESEQSHDTHEIPKCFFIREAVDNEEINENSASTKSGTHVEINCDCRSGINSAHAPRICAPLTDLHIAYIGAFLVQGRTRTNSTLDFDFWRGN